MARAIVAACLLVAALMSLAAASQPVRGACESAVRFTPAEVAQRVRVIVLARIAGYTNVPRSRRAVGLDVLRVIKGDVGRTLRIERPMIHFCSALEAPVGSRIVIASSITGPFTPRELKTYHPTWFEQEDGSWAGPGFTGDLESLIRAFQLPPDTSTAAGGAPSTRPEVLLLTMAALAGVLLARRRLDAGANTSSG